MKDALTAEEWAGYLERGDTVCREEGQITAGLRGAAGDPVIGVASDPHEYGAILPGLCHAIAALCLHDQPFGFTREMLDCMTEFNDDRQTSERREIAEQGFDRIEALLPPEKT